MIDTARADSVETMAASRCDELNKKEQEKRSEQ